MAGVIDDIATALPADADKDDNLLRTVLLRDFIQNIPDATDPETVNPVDAGTGATAPAVAFERQIFWFESEDVSSVHDGITVLVLVGGKRYIISDFADLRITSVLDKDLDTPPGSPAIGDSYLLPAAPTGAWAAKTKHVATWTGRGGGSWRFAAPRKGWLLLVEDEDKHYKYTAAAAWALALEPVAQSVVASHLNSGLRRAWRVQNQTVNAPPASVAQGASYIIGPSPTGAWSGQSGKIGTREASGTGAVDTIYAPRPGDQAKDLALNIALEWDGLTWVSLAGAVVGFARTFTATGSTNVGGSSIYTYSDTVAPAIATHGRTDEGSITHTAKRSGALLEFNYQFRAGAAGSAVFVIALFRDSEVNALDWTSGPDSGGTFLFSHRAILSILSDDIVSHDYFIRLVSHSTTRPDPITRRTLIMREYA